MSSAGVDDLLDGFDFSRPRTPPSALRLTNPAEPFVDPRTLDLDEELEPMMLLTPGTTGATRLGLFGTSSGTGAAQSPDGATPIRRRYDRETYFNKYVKCLSRLEERDMLRQFLQVSTMCL